MPEVLRSVPTAVHAVKAEQETDSMLPPVTVAFADVAIVQLGSTACAPTALAPTKITTSGAATIALLMQSAAVRCFRQRIMSPALRPIRYEAAFSLRRATRIDISLAFSTDAINPVS